MFAFLITAINAAIMIDRMNTKKWKYSYKYLIYTEKFVWFLVHHRLRFFLFSVSDNFQSCCKMRMCFCTMVYPATVQEINEQETQILSNKPHNTHTHTERERERECLIVDQR